MRKINFIHYAFLVMTGFLCGYHYYPASGSRRGKVRSRLLSRSLKLFIIFIAGNVAFYALGYGRFDFGSVSFSSDMLVMLRGLLFSVPDEAVAFEILYLISLFLFGVGLIIGFPWTKWLLLAVVFLPVVIDSIPLLFMALGCAGMLVGMTAKEGRCERLKSWIHVHLWVFPLILSLIIALVPTTNQWAKSTKGLFVFFLVATPCWFFTALWIVKGLKIKCVQDQIILLGRYTLPAYVLQMIFAHVTYNVLCRSGLGDFAYYGISLLVVGVITWLMVATVDRVRTYSSFWDGAYRVVFQ